MWAKHQHKLLTEQCREPASSTFWLIEKWSNILLADQFVIHVLGCMDLIQEEIDYYISQCGNKFWLWTIKWWTVLILLQSVFFNVYLFIHLHFLHVKCFFYVPPCFSSVPFCCSDQTSDCFIGLNIFLCFLSLKCKVWGCTVRYTQSCSGVFWTGKLRRHEFQVSLFLTLWPAKHILFVNAYFEDKKNNNNKMISLVFSLSWLSLCETLDWRGYSSSLPCIA